jgi:Uma2 family endonuclease
MPVLTKHRFNTQEYYRMAETGLLKPDAHVELLEGQIIDMSPIGPFHGGVVNRLTRIFTSASRNRWLVSIQNPMRLDKYSEPQPDLMLLRPAAADYTSRHPGPSDVLLLIEVADTSIAYDRDEKLPAYARAGIPEVWIVNLLDQTIEVYREPQSAGYNSTLVLHPGDEAHPVAFPDVLVSLSALLKQ